MEDTLGRRMLTDVQRIATFWSRVTVRAGGECWLWKGAVQGKYGAFRYDGATKLAHRFAASIKHGPLARGVVVCHACDTPLCVNPEHLFLGTYAINMMDAVNKGRMPRGEKVTGARLTAEVVRAIRQSPMTQAWLAEKYGVDPSTIYHVLKRKTWRHL
jgi:HNH endonuclease